MPERQTWHPCLMYVLKGNVKSNEDISPPKYISSQLIIKWGEKKDKPDYGQD